VLNGSHLYLDGLQAGSLVPARILSTTDGLATGTFGGSRLPAFDAANMYRSSGTGPFDRVRLAK